VYAPSLSIGSGPIRINTDAPVGSTASVSTYLDSAFADDPTTCSVNWGDGSISNNPTLRSNTTHVFSITSGLSQAWTATFSGSNQAGATQATQSITVLMRPRISLSVEGIEAIAGNTIQVEAGEPLDLSLLNSEGYIENASFAVPGRIDESGTSMTCSDLTFDNSDIGQTFTLTANVSNTGDGNNSDSVTVNLTVVPEPATLSLLILGGLALLRRWK
jgi:uncharacterized cupredoxin-like copper-binding protein